ncbi:hypothetical protein IVB16_00405 [Bradyrhizobium sp. 183]|uniref:hypothetical protein n=1 Tax=unclassified Bradyrhizobium TaxID=2631580 RepID=UPI001FFFC088|nr:MULTISPECIES: hypothetical protein [unclassified Bradyrhizobium]UPJ80537.1 hypothetical protein IVB17_00405 [Bradyrhizobium sp. 184]UPJ88331.1 hypothetical protein IVB16_00405 [Bradyrhizobium sp. 183]
MTDNPAINRRRLVQFLMIAFGSSLNSKQASSQAVQSGDEAVLRVIGVETSVQELTKKSAVNIDRSFYSLSLLLSAKDLNSFSNAAAAASLVESMDGLSPKSILLPLREALRLGLSPSPVGASDARLSNQGFEGIVDRASGGASLILGLALRASNAKSDISDYARRLPHGSDLDRTARLALAALSKKRAAELPTEVIRLANLDFLARPRDLEEATKRLPENVRSLAREMFRISRGEGAGDAKKIRDMLGNALGQSISNASRDARGPPAQRLLLSSDFDAARARASKASADINAAASFAEFVLSDYLKDSKGARDVARGMQVANLAVTIGLAVSTGGVGCLAMAGSLASGIGALNSGASADNSGLTRAMFVALSDQIDALRQDMDFRFNRLETIEIEALGLLKQISLDLRDLKITVTDKMTSIQENLVQIEQYLKESDRKEILDRFNSQIQKCRGVLEDPGAFDQQYKKDLLLSLLNHAIDASGHPSLTSAASARPSSVIKNAERTDLLVGQLTSCAQLLGLNASAQTKRNPIEWARGAQAFAESSPVFSIESKVISDRAREAWEAGKSMRDELVRLSSRNSIEVAANNYRKACAEVRLFVLRSLDERMSTVGHYFRVGRPTRARLESDYSPKELPDIPDPHYLYYFNAFPSKMRMTKVWGDPIAEGIRGGILSLSTKKTEPLNVVLNPQFQPTWQTRLGDRHRLNILDRRGSVLAEVDMIDIDVKKHVPTWTAEHFKFKAFDFSSDTLNIWKKLSPVWDAVYNQFDDRGEIAKWVNSLPEDVTLGDGRKFNDVAASFMLLLGLASWRSSDHLDDPWRSGISSQLWRSFLDVKTELLDLTVGMSGVDADYLLPVSVHSNANSVPLTDVISISDSSSSPSKYASYATQFRLAGQRVRVEWQALPTLVFYPTLISTVMNNRIEHLGSAKEFFMKVSQQSGDDSSKGISILDRTVLSLGAVLEP